MICDLKSELSRSQNSPRCYSLRLSSISEIPLRKHKRPPIRASNKPRPARIKKRRRVRRIALLPSVRPAAQVPHQISAFDPCTLERPRRLATVVRKRIAVNPVILRNRPDVERGALRKRYVKAE